MKYELGNMDYYHVAMAWSVIGSMPVYKVQLDEKVDGDRLKRATRKALSFNPLFATKFIYEGKYMLETNEEDFEIIHCDMEHRPLLMGKGWNGNHYWQVCYFQNEILLECFHDISDGRGILRFLQDIL